MASDPSFSSQVDAILSQAMDEVALQNIAALNTAHLTESPLPPPLESRFRSLKSLNRALPTSPNPKPSKPISPLDSQSPSNPSPEQTQNSSNPSLDQTQNPFPEKTHNPPLPVATSIEKEAFEASPVRIRPKSPDGSGCCFGFRKKKKKEKGDLGGDEELFWILKEERRKMKKALEKQEKVNREAEKIVEMVRQASVRLDFSAIDEFLSDEEKSI